MMHLFVVIILSSLAYGLPPELRDLRENARLAVRTSHCAGCHAPSLSPKPTAVKVFNLDQKNWSSTMTDSNLARLRWALKDATAEEIKAMGADPKKNTLSKAQVETILKFVDMELKFRKQKPLQRFSDIQQMQNPGFSNLLSADKDSCTL